MREHGIDEERALAQLGIFREGQKHTRLERPCTLGDGILRFPREELAALGAGSAQAASQGRLSQFVPASGAATRMFKGLAAVLNRDPAPAFADLERQADENGGGDADARETVAWFRGLLRFPFLPQLRAALAEQGKDLEALIASRDYRPVLECLLSPQGLDFSRLPKALIPFHASPEGPRLALEEHVAEASELIRDGQGLCRLHFTVSSEHQDRIRSALDSLRGRYQASGTRFDIALSRQESATDTLAVGPGNEPLRNPDGTLCFRPGGHGALLENLAGTGGDIVFIKNIDNVATPAARAEALSWRKALSGHLLRLQAGAFAHLRGLRPARDGGAAAGLVERVEAAARFAEDDLCVRLPDAFRAPSAEAPALAAKRDYLIAALDRPLRVCSMVPNQGEPGGGPFWVRDRDGSLRPQIVESAQVDMADAGQRALAASATHFNPVDMVCALRDERGEAYPLHRFVDPDACFITEKSKDGKPLKALELPGLWNGSMAHWNTVFVELPAATFNPVKTVNDLLRPSHQGENKRKA